MERAKTGRCRIGTCHGGKGLGGSESTTDRHFERQRVDGERCAQPLRLREKKWGERESGTRKCKRERVARRTAPAEQCNRNNGNHSSTSSSSRSTAQAVTYFSTGLEKPDNPDAKIKFPAAEVLHGVESVSIPTCPEGGCLWRDWTALQASHVTSCHEVFSARIPCLRKRISLCG